jgi:hypothetical protein
MLRLENMFGSVTTRGGIRGGDLRGECARGPTLAATPFNVPPGAYAILSFLSIGPRKPASMLFPGDFNPKVSLSRLRAAIILLRRRHAQSSKPPMANAITPTLPTTTPTVCSFVRFEGVGAAAAAWEAALVVDVGDVVVSDSDGDPVAVVIVLVTD